MKKTKEKKKVDISTIVTFVFFGIALISATILLIDTILNTKSDLNYYTNIIFTALIAGFTLFFTFSNIFIERRMGKILATCSALLIICYSSFSMMINHGLIKIPELAHMDDFTGKSLTEVIKYTSANNISLNQIYEYSDNVPEYHVINQSVRYGTLLKDIESIDITISLGPDIKKEVILPNMVGQSVDNAITFVEENFFTNVSIDFIESKEFRDQIINQDKSGNVQRNEKVIFTVSLGELSEIGTTEMVDLKDTSYFYATTWCKRHLIEYEIEYVYSDDVEKDHVISFDKNLGDILNPKDKIKIVISKGPKVEVPDILNMSVEDVTDWVINSKLKISYYEEYSSEVPQGKIIRSNVKPGDVIETGKNIEIYISRGSLKVEDFKNIAELKEWATENNIELKENYEFSNDVSIGELIGINKNVGDKVIPGDVIEVRISNGKEYIIPNTVGKNKNDASNLCKNSGITCSFIYQYSNSVQSGYVIRQSKVAGSSVSSNAVLTITISNGANPTPTKTPTPTQTQKPTPTVTPTPVQCVPKSYTIGRDYMNCKNQSDYNAIANCYKNYFTSKGVTAVVKSESGTGLASGSYISGPSLGESVTSCNTNNPVVIVLAK